MLQKSIKQKLLLELLDCALVDAKLIDNFIKIYKRKKSSFFK